MSKPSLGSNNGNKNFGGLASLADFGMIYAGQDDIEDE